MPTYVNLPSNRIELLDGNLIVDAPLEGNTVLVIDTAYSGPTGRQVLLTDSNLAKRVYGEGSPLLQKANEAKLGGAKNIILYRIGGKAASLEGIFGQDTYIKTVDETTTAGSEYSIYIGPQPGNPLQACLIGFQGSRIVYSNVPGSEIDLGKLVVEGFDFDTTITVGTPTAPVPLDTVSPAAAVVETIQPATSETKIFLEGAISNSAVVSSVTKNGNPLVVTTDYTFNATTGILTLVVAADGTDDYVVSYTRSATKASAILEYTATGATASITLPAVGVNNGGVIGYVYKNGTAVVAGGPNGYAFNATTGTITLSGTSQGTAILPDVYNVGFAYNTPSNTVYVPGENNVNAGWKKLYELLDEAYSNLETTLATECLVGSAILDAANIADGSVAVNRLEYFRKYEDIDGQIVYEWSTDKIHYKDGSSTTTNIMNADLDSNGQPIISKRYNEVNFVHQFGEFLNSLTENDRFVLGFIGTSAPASYSNANINKWIGVMPEYDIDGTIIANGTGLLGNKFLAGTITRTPGFYKTDSGFPDGIPQQDSNGAFIDLGKFLSVVAGLVTLPVSPIAGTNGQVINAAGLYAGLSTTIIPGNSTTNELLAQRLSLPFEIKKPKLDLLSLVGYVVLQLKARGVVVVSGELATNANSDYDYISTSIIVREFANRVRDRLDVYIGKGLDPVRLTAMQTAVDGVIKDLAEAGALIKAIAQVVPTSTFGITIPYTLVPPFELRDINNIIKLSKDI